MKKSLLTIVSILAATQLFTACEQKVEPAAQPQTVEKNTTIVNPPAAEKKTETNTTVVNPPAAAESKTTEKTDTTTTTTK